MGIYDIYEGIQLKVGECILKEYHIGDTVNIPDGIYIGNEGAVVIKDGKLLWTTENIQTKWGETIDIDSYNPISTVIKEIEKKKRYWCPECKKEVKRSNEFTFGHGHDGCENCGCFIEELKNE